MSKKTTSKKTRAEQISDLFVPDQEHDIEDYDRNDDETIQHEEDISIFKPKRKAKEGKLLRASQTEEDTKYTGVKVSRRDLSGRDDLQILDEDDKESAQLIQEEIQKYNEYMNRNIDHQEDKHVIHEQIDDHLDELEKSDVVDHIQAQRRKEKQKANCVFNQKIVYDSLLKLRILLQKPLQMANRMPQYDIQQEFRQDEKIEQGLSGIESNIMESIQELVNLQSSLIEQNPRIKCPKIEVKDNVDDLWTSIQAQYESFSSYRDTSLEDWNRRTKLSSGIDAKNFKTINTSLDAQVKMVLKEKDSLIKKSQKVTFDAPILGKRKREEEDAEIFEDKEFYQLLLRDLIEDVGTSLGSKENIRNAIRNNLKKDKKPFRRNRGKEIKYVVHPKLVGFMAPQERDLPEGSDKLFANLFGGIPQEFAAKIQNLTD